MSVFSFLVPAAFLLSSVSSVTLTGDAVFVISDADRFNNTALNLTLSDVIIDFYQVLGLAPSILSPDSIDCTTPFLPADFISRIYFGTFTNNPSLASLVSPSECYSGPESHCLILKYANSTTNSSSSLGTTLFALSNDTRGAIYAAYSFSELILGIDPLHRFSGLPGVYRGGTGFGSGGIKNISKTYKKVFGPPVFEYRALFNNDEDLLGGWGSDPYGRAVHSGTVFSWLYESILRMKGNMMIVGTVPFPDEVSIGLASKRGIVVTDHHFNLMGANTFRFPSELNDEWDWMVGPGTLKFVWEASRDAMRRNVQNYANEIVWSVGWRGRNDEAAPCDGCSTKEQGLIMSEVIGNMSQEWLEPDDLKITYMWDEALSFYSQGYLKIPDDVSIILTDGGDGFIDGVDEYGNISDGIYTHTAMYNGNANQLTEMVSPARQFDQIGNFIKRGRKTKYAIINTSDLKPVLLSTMAVFNYLFDPNCCTSGAMQYMIDWCYKHYILRDTDDPTQRSIATDIAAFYDAYYNISYVSEGVSDNGVGGAVITVASAFIDSVNNYSNSLDYCPPSLQSEFASRALANNASFAYIEELWDNVTSYYTNKQLESILIPQSADLYRANIILQLGYQYYGNLGYNAMYAACRALSDMDSIGSHRGVPARRGDDQYHYHSSRRRQMSQMSSSALDQLNQSIAYLDAVFALENDVMQRGPWRGVYFYSYLSNWQRVRSTVRQLYQMLANSLAAQNVGKGADLRQEECLLPLRESQYYGFTWYQLPNANNYPLFEYDANYHINTLVRMRCLNLGSLNNTDAQNGCCVNNANGGVFKNFGKDSHGNCNGTAIVQVNVLANMLGVEDRCQTVRYTNDGTDPDANSFEITLDSDGNGKLTIEKSMEIRASCEFVNGSMDAQITRTNWTLLE